MRRREVFHSNTRECYCNCFYFKLSIANSLFNAAFPSKNQLLIIVLKRFSNTLVHCFKNSYNSVQLSENTNVVVKVFNGIEFFWMYFEDFAMNSFVCLVVIKFHILLIPHSWFPIRGHSFSTVDFSWCSPTLLAKDFCASCSYPLVNSYFSLQHNFYSCHLCKCISSMDWHFHSLMGFSAMSRGINIS